MRSIPTAGSSLHKELHQALDQCRAGTLQMMAELDEATLCQQAHPDFSPVGWHLGHIAFTEAIWILEHLAGLSPQFPQYRRLFAADGLPKHDRTRLPTLPELHHYLDTVRQQVLDYLTIAPLDEQLRLWRWLLQHESQHNETMTIVLELHRQKCPSSFVLRPLSFDNGNPITHDQGQMTHDQGQMTKDQGQTTKDQGQMTHNQEQMVYIPASEFEMGSEAIDAIDNERPVHRVLLGGYWIDRYPVTCGQYRQFMVAGGYGDRRWWLAEGWEWLQSQAAQGHAICQPLYWRDDPHWDDHPVSGVSWYEAAAYAAFVGKRLPTEAEWERAALGATAGNHDRQHRHTTPVTAHPGGQSHAGCDDMLGNVWEWTDSWFIGYDRFAAYPYAGYSQNYFDGKHRVLRGGSWATRPWALRSTVRNWYYPTVRQMLAGFRCAQSIA